MTTLVDFLRARIAHDERVYRGSQHGLRPEMVKHLLQEVGAKRLTIRFLGDLERGEFGDSMTSSLAYSVLCRLATVYADHPDYREEWRP